MMQKTKAELEQEIKDLKQQLESAKTKESYDNSAKETKAMYDSYVKAGFTKEQAWTIIITLVSNATQKRTLF
mgnify:FL=1